MMDDDQHRTVAERYATATHSGNLTPRLRGLTDADTLLAAGIAACGDKERWTALSLHRMRLSGDLGKLPSVVADIEEWMKNRASNTGRVLPRHTRRALVVDTLRWWLNATCRYCNGIGTLPMTDESSQVLRVSCGVCHGRKRRPLADDVPRVHLRYARIVVDRIDALVLQINADMKRLLSHKGET